MRHHEFVFALRLCEDVRFDGMLRELTRRVLGFVGCPPGASAEIGDQLLAGLSQCEARRAGCHVEFHARAREIAITLSAGGRPVFSTSRRLP